MIGIHQPNYLPWLGFFDKARAVDTFVLLDTVPYTRGSVINRNRIKTKNGGQWITVPTHRVSGTTIRDTLTADTNWESDHWKTLVCNYSGAKHFHDFAPAIQEVYAKRWVRLAKLNETLIRLVLNSLGFHPRIVRASDLGVEGKSSMLLARICKALGEREYLSGVGAKEYLDLDLFRREGISVKFQRFVEPVYLQLFGEFISNLSVVDYLFNCGATEWSHGA